VIGVRRVVLVNGEVQTDVIESWPYRSVEQIETESKLTVFGQEFVVTTRLEFDQELWPRPDASEPKFEDVDDGGRQRSLYEHLAEPRQHPQDPLGPGPGMERDTFYD
jgi:hypothetical protein